MSFDARLVFLSLCVESMVLDCVAGDRNRLMLGHDQLEPGEPFSLEVSIPGKDWIGPVLSALERWSSDGRQLKVDLWRSHVGIQARISDDTTSGVFDLVALMGRRPPRTSWGHRDAPGGMEC